MFATAGLVLGTILLYGAMVAGFLVIPLGIPGQLLIVLAALLFTLAAGSAHLPWWVTITLLILAVLAELLEGVFGFLGAKQAKGSVWSALGGIVGGIVGAILGSAVAPILGSLAGAFAGTFAGAFAVEYYRTTHAADARAVAKGALIGRVAGSLVKLVVAGLMIAIVTHGLAF
jgi:uncharacterized protein YqgC (DUF456 family)